MYQSFAVAQAPLLPLRRPQGCVSKLLSRGFLGSQVSEFQTWGANVCGVIELSPRGPSRVLGDYSPQTRQGSAIHFDTWPMHRSALAAALTVRLVKSPPSQLEEKLGSADAGMRRAPVQVNSIGIRSRPEDSAEVAAGAFLQCLTTVTARQPELPAAS